uniref:NADH-ubiquinone oxidoreductase chain 6 n=1 Tax=Sipyloidea sipylus TaxID=202427 RepID=E2RV45_SIPSI|nr:NADH dehydrogenase subunit 6 [Sipyloidea sipylus]
MKMLMMMNMLMNMMFMTMKHPLSMGLMIIIQTIIISMTTGLMYKSFWFSYILFLMYVGGMMVLFMYMTSLMPNMIFTMSKKNIIMIIMLLTIMSMFIYKEQMIMNNDMIMSNKSLLMMKMYNKPINISIMLLASYLLFTMITVFKITEINKGPLRMMFN